ncbi:MAG: hypothetical protein ACI4A5_03300 [Hominilimicola sp.]
MQIKKSTLKNKLPRRMRTLQDGEMFYAIDGMPNYCFSNQFRLCQRSVNENNKESYKIVHSRLSYKKKYFTCPHFKIIDEAGEEKFVSIKYLIKKTFFKNELVCLELINPEGEWEPDNIMALSREEWIYRFECLKKQAKFNVEEYKIQLPNFRKTDIAKICNDKYDGMRRRAVNKSYKKRHPGYQNTIMYSKWIDNPEMCKQYLMENYYEYPGELVIDKDLMSFGLLDTYSPGIAIFLPVYLNNIFQKSVSEFCFGIKKNQSGNYQVPEMGLKSKTFANYDEALNYARKSKAESINRYADKEEKDGYMPDYIINQMRRWTALCRDGRIEIWESKDECAKSEKNKNK